MPLSAPTSTRRWIGSFKLSRSTAEITPATASWALPPRPARTGTLTRIGRSIASVTSWAEATTGLRRLRNRKIRYGTRPPSSAPNRAANQTGNVEVDCSGLANTSWKIGPGIRCSAGISAWFWSNTPRMAGMTWALTASESFWSGLETTTSM